MDVHLVTQFGTVPTKFSIFNLQFSTIRTRKTSSDSRPERKTSTCRDLQQSSSTVCQDILSDMTSSNFHTQDVRKFCDMFDCSNKIFKSPSFQLHNKQGASKQAERKDLESTHVSIHNFNFNFNCGQLLLHTVEK